MYLKGNGYVSFVKNKIKRAKRKRGEEGFGGTKEGLTRNTKKEEDEGGKRAKSFIIDKGELNLP